MVHQVLSVAKTSPFVPLFINSNSKVHNNALEGLVKTDAKYFDVNPTGIVINRFCKDAGSIDNFLIDNVNFLSYNGLVIIFAIMLAFIILPLMIIAFPVLVLLYFLIFQYTFKNYLEAKHVETILKGRIISTYNSILSGSATIRALKLENKFLSELNEKNSDYYDAYYVLTSLLFFIQVYSELVFVLYIATNMGLIIVFRDDLDIYLASFSLSLAFTTYNATSFAIQNTLTLFSLFQSVQRLLDYSELPAEGDYELNKDFRITTGKVEFRKVYMRYRADCKLSLRNLSFTVVGGQKLGIVGRTGAGKSSILQVLFRLVNPELGTVFIDEVDYMTIGLHDLRKQISVIPQSTVLFTSSIRDNLDPFHECSDERILEVLNQVKLKAIVLETKDGLDTCLGYDSLNFSSGQKQLLGLARILIRQNKIVVLDEATSGVDNETDAIIQELLGKVYFDSVLIVIAHRLRSVVGSDVVIVMDEGTCKEIGNPKELIDKDDSLFRSIVENTGDKESKFLIKEFRNGR